MTVEKMPAMVFKIWVSYTHAANKWGKNSNLADDIREKLGIMNVHHASLFPDPDGVAAFLNNEWSAITTQYPRRRT